MDTDQNGITLSMIRKDYYNESIAAILKSLEGKKVCFVTLNRPSGPISMFLKMNNIQSDNIFFIDAVSSGLGHADSGKDENICYVSSPAALTEISIALGEAIKTNAFDAVVFDSISTLLIYPELNTSAEKFLAHVMDMVRDKKLTAVFTCIADDKNSNLAKTASMHADSVSEFEQLYEKYDNAHQAATIAAVTSVLGLCAYITFSNGSIFTRNLLTGFSIIPKGLPDIATFLILVGLALNVAVLLYKFSELLKPVPDEKLKTIKPAVQKDADVKQKVKAKVHAWQESMKVKKHAG